MLEFFAGMFTAYFLTWPAIAIMGGLGIWFVYTDSRTLSVIATLLLGFTSIIYFDIPVTLKGSSLALVSYFSIGVVWSFWRYKRYIDEVVETANAGTNYDRQLAKAATQPAKTTPMIVTWIIAWPFSAVENIAHDLISGITKLVKTVFRNIYAKIYSSGIAKLNPIDDK